MLTGPPTPAGTGTIAPVSSPHRPGTTPVQSAATPEARRVWCLTGGLVATVAVVALGRFFVQDPRGLLADHAAFEGASLGRAQFQPVADLVLGFVSVPFLLLATALAGAVALGRRRWGDAVRVIVIVVGANLTTQVLKALVERPDTTALTQFSLENSLPSGHTTVAASVAAIALVAAPPALRPWAALVGAGYAALTGVATMSLGWHRPSDVLAALGVVAAWTLTALGLSLARRTGPPAASTTRVTIAWILGVGAAVGIGLGAAALLWTLARAGTDLTASSEALSLAATRLAFIGSSLGVVGAAALTCWSILLARR